MLREILDKLSGTQITTMVLAAIFVPGAVGAAVTYQAVGLVDPNTGSKAYIDSGRRLSTQDFYTAQRQNPLNFVKIVTSYTTSIGTIYTVPTGKSLIITSANMMYFNGLSNTDNYFYLQDSANGLYFSGIEQSTTVASQSSNFGNGYYIKSGDSIRYIASTNLRGSVSVQGYLVPSTAVPASGSAEEREQTAVSAPAPKTLK